MYQKKQNWHIRNLLPKVPQLVTGQEPERRSLRPSPPLLACAEPETLNELVPKGLGWPHTAAWGVHPLSDTARTRDGVAARERQEAGRERPFHHL